MKTEEKARKCWCPFARVNVPVSFPIGGNVSQTIGTAAVNRFVRNEQGAAMAACIASECMAWQWEKGDADKWQDGIHHEFHTGSVAKGYCGLAGKP